MPFIKVHFLGCLYKREFLLNLLISCRKALLYIIRLHETEKRTLYYIVEKRSKVMKSILKKVIS